MPDKKRTRKPAEGSAGAFRAKQRGKNTLSLREKALQSLKTFGTKDMAVPNTGGLMARLAAQRLAKAAGAAKPAAAEAAKTGAKTSPWVKNAQAGKLPPKALMGGAPAAAMVTPSKKPIRKAPKSPPRKAPVRSGASSNSYRPKSAAAKRRAN